MSDYVKLTIAMLRELWAKAPVKLRFTSSLETVHADCVVWSNVHVIRKDKAGRSRVVSTDALKSIMGDMIFCEYEDQMACITVGEPTHTRLPDPDPCGPCRGTGRFITHVLNGVPAGPAGYSCHRCAGKGFQTKADEKRNWGYDNFAPIRGL
jgi:hypothetical protein